MQILIATGNPHKRDEIRAIFNDADAHAAEMVGWLTLADLPERYAEPTEDGDTFEANAQLKARYYAGVSGYACIADDSGLEIDALSGAPGIYSARYAGASGTRAAIDLANNRKLLDELARTPAERRGARFVCAMALAVPGGDVPSQRLSERWTSLAQRSDGPAVITTVRGTIEGQIIEPDQADDPQHAERGRGKNGFGYDPLFFVPELGCTTAELTPEHKNQVSHRASAARKLHAELRERGLIG